MEKLDLLFRNNEYKINESDCSDRYCYEKWSDRWNMQRIEIRYLGPVQELEMEIKDFNLLIGEQATGKSTVAKAIYFF